MLVELALNNLLIVDQAKLQPGQGLCAITGETGAGKSLLLDALALVAGARGDAGLVGPTADHCLVTAVIQVDSERAAAVEAVCGVAIDRAESQVILRRRISANGRSQAWINDVPVTVAALRQAADLLIAIHAQHEPLRLAEPARQVAVLDAYGGHDTAAYGAAQARWIAASNDQRELAEGGRGSVRELEFLRFQLQELDALGPRAGEVAELEARQRLLSEAGQWRDAAAEAAAVLGEGDRCVHRQLGRIAKRLTGAPDEGLHQVAEACRQAADLVADAAARASDAGERLADDPAELARISDRLDAWNALLRKHGPGEADLIAAHTSLAARAEALANLDEHLAKAAAEVVAARAECLRLGAELARARTTAFARLAAEVHQRLAKLGLAQARLSLTGSDTAEPTALGTVRQEFLVSTNPGFPAGPLGSVASGGESARLSLALAAALANQDGTPLLVFDEVDSGVGGRLAGAIGAALRELGAGRTVLCVTHAPHLAASAARQYVVRKEQGSDRTRTRVEEVYGDHRQAELAEMLGGGIEARRQAAALMAAGGAAR